MVVIDGKDFALKKRMVCFLIECLVVVVFCIKLFHLTGFWSAEYQVSFLDAFVLSGASYIWGMLYLSFTGLSDKVYDYIRNVLKKYF